MFFKSFKFSNCLFIIPSLIKSSVENSSLRESCQSSACLAINGSVIFTMKS